MASETGSIVFDDLKRLKTVRADLQARGKTAPQLAEELGVGVSTIYGVLGGQKRCLRGDAHKVAVMLGLKDGVVE